MAKIDVSKMAKIEKTKITVHEEAEATYSVFTKDEERYFQIDTYGAPGRKFVNKVSQTIQISRKDARKLIDLLKYELNL